jgi:hypothetical protein
MAQIRLGRFEVEGRQLPRICVRCGAPAAILLNKNFAWQPYWVFLLFLAGVFSLIGLVPFVIVAVIFTKRMRVAVPFCGRHRGYWRKLNVLGFGGVAAAALFVFAVSYLTFHRDQNGSDFTSWLCVTGFSLVIVWLVGFAVMWSNSIRATDISDHSITLTGVSSGFVQAVYAQHGAGMAAKVLASRCSDAGEEQFYDPRF